MAAVALCEGPCSPDFVFPRLSDSPRGNRPRWRSRLFDVVWFLRHGLLRILVAAFSACVISVSSFLLFWWCFPSPMARPSCVAFLSFDLLTSTVLIQSSSLLRYVSCRVLLLTEVTIRLVVAFVFFRCVPFRDASPLFASSVAAPAQALATSLPFAHA